MLWNSYALHIVIDMQISLTTAQIGYHEPKNNHWDNCLLVRVLCLKSTI